jgi:hypothetical protein
MNLTKTDTFIAMIRDILNNDWDPIGIKSIPINKVREGWLDEYDMYIPSIYEMLLQDRPAIEIMNYLLWVETERMGLSGRTDSAVNVANKLIAMYQINKKRENGK